MILRYYLGMCMDITTPVVPCNSSCAAAAASAPAAEHVIAQVMT
jgi:hypothetical protein